jgi:hypothetical protein
VTPPFFYHQEGHNHALPDDIFTYPHTLSFPPVFVIDRIALSTI